jgi:hypothetical protein
MQVLAVFRMPRAQRVEQSSADAAKRRREWRRLRRNTRKRKSLRCHGVLTTPGAVLQPRSPLPDAALQASWAEVSHPYDRGPMARAPWCCGSSPSRFPLNGGTLACTCRLRVRAPLGPCPTG